MRLSTEWISEGANASAEERATLCNLQIFVDGENACLHFDPDSKTTFEHITVPAVHLAEGLATDWWSIFGGRPRASDPSLPDGVRPAGSELQV